MNPQDKRKSKPSIETNLPPQARDLEVSVLGLIMEFNCFDSVADILKPECFYVPAHMEIFTAMKSMQAGNIPIDINTVVQELLKVGKLAEIGGPIFITQLTNLVGIRVGHIEAHAKIIRDKFLERQLSAIGHTIHVDAYDSTIEVKEKIEAAGKAISDLTIGMTGNDYVDISTATDAALKRIEMLRHQTGNVTGIPTGFTLLDKITHGWQATDLIILAARPSIGKTAFSLNLARTAAYHPVKPVPVGFFSLEMSTGQLVNRLLSAQSEVWLDEISTGKLSDESHYKLYEKGVKAFQKKMIFIDDTAALSLFQLRAKARRMVNKHKVGLIIIDYLQLMSASDGSKIKNNINREQEISHISRGLKALAKELSIPVIALSQLSRAVETRKESKIPQLSDLRESGAIEADADMVMFIYRPEYYETNSNEMGESTNGETHIRIAKHRNGSLGNIKLRANLAIQKFEDWDDRIVMPGNFKPVDFTEPKKVKVFTGNNFDEGFEDQPF